jgi:hypothetical protein
MATAWHDINDPGVFRRSPASPARAEPADSADSAAPQKKEPEVKLVSATWDPGKEGFEFNKKCNLLIKAQFLKPTTRKRVLCDLFVTYDGAEENLNSQVEAFLDDSGNAKAEFTLYYGDAYNRALETKPDAHCLYTAKVKHSSAPAELVSEQLDMPQAQGKGVFKVRLNIDPAKDHADDDAFILFSTDAKGSYSKTLTIKDDKIKGDAYLDLEFVDLIEGLNYSLKVLPGNKKKGYLLFKEKPYKEIV